MELKGKRVTVFGLGKSGRAAAKKLSSLGAVVTTTDSKTGEHPPEVIEGADLIVVSPGVHLDIPVLLAAAKKKVPIIGELELASWFLSKPIIAITGTNGKTTTTTLIGEMLKAAGKKTTVAGNIGRPLVEIDDKELDYLVVEVSSYQLETIQSFRPWIGVILNLQPDHLERHHTIAEYARMKQRLFQNQTGDDYLVYNQDDPAVAELVKTAVSRKIGFSKNHLEIITLDPKEIRIPGRHNLENSLAAAQAARLAGIDDKTIAQVLRSFPGVEHRIEYAGEVGGIKCYNDSKGTNPDSTIVALETFVNDHVILILGGRDKGVDLAPLMARLKLSHIKGVILVGEGADRFEQSLKAAGIGPIVRAGFSLEKAVAEGLALGKKGDILLLSPACASFDMFRDYEERGREFKKLCQK